MRVEEWIGKMTEGSKTVVELGAGQFDRLDHCSHTVTKRIGIEIFPPYIAARKNRVPVELIEWDMQDWAFVLAPRDTLDTAMLIDSLEHINKDDGNVLLLGLQTTFKRILVFTPDGLHPQEDDATGYNNPYQRHLSGWTQNDLMALGFACVVDQTYDTSKPSGMIFAVWNR